MVFVENPETATPTPSTKHHRRRLRGLRGTDPKGAEKNWSPAASGNGRHGTPRAACPHSQVAQSSDGQGLEYATPPVNDQNMDHTHRRNKETGQTKQASGEKTRRKTQKTEKQIGVEGAGRGASISLQPPCRAPAHPYRSRSGRRRRSRCRGPRPPALPRVARLESASGEAEA